MQDKLDLFGLSYGTYLMTVSAEREGTIGDFADELERFNTRAQ